MSSNYDALSGGVSAFGIGGMGAVRRGGFGSGGALGAASYSPVAALGTDLIAYWDASRADLMTIATGISSWRDIVAGYDAVQATGTTQPIYSATSFNGGPSVTFDGTDDCLTCTTAGLLAALPAGAVGSESWLVASQDSAAADTTTRSILAYGGDTFVSQRRIRRQSAGTNLAAAETGDGASSGVATSTATYFGRQLTRAEFGPTVTTLWIDGLAQAPTASVIPATGANRLRLGANSNSTAAAFFQGKIVVAIITKPLGAAKAAALQTYLLSRRLL